MEELAEKLSTLYVSVNKHNNENVPDISPNGIKENSYIAFGNDANDISMFEHALNTVKIGYHEHLAVFAKETITLTGDYEQKIVEKIRTLPRNMGYYKLH